MTRYTVHPTLFTHDARKWYVLLALQPIGGETTYTFTLWGAVGNAPSQAQLTDSMRSCHPSQVAGVVNRMEMRRIGRGYEVHRMDPFGSTDQSGVARLNFMLREVGVKNHEYTANDLISMMIAAVGEAPEAPVPVEAPAKPKRTPKRRAAGESHIPDCKDWRKRLSL